MNLFDQWNWTWPAFALAFCLGALGMRWLYRRFGFAKKSKVNKDYFKGLNFLLNEETDKAIEAFIKALEVDSETVELHLALGGLFRRKGQVDRATRLHQNLIARPNLTEKQRFEAIYELAQDYYKAGWLDRAEGLFDELKSSENYHTAAINGLCNIYQQEREWQQAIDILNEHRPSQRSQHLKQIAHYYCELADIAIENLDYSVALNMLQASEKQVKGNARTILLRGELAYQQGDFAEAIIRWSKLRSDNATSLQLVSGKVIKCYQEAGDREGLEQHLLTMKSIPKHGQDFKLWYEALVDVFGSEAAELHILRRVEGEGLSGPVANHLHHAVVSRLVSDQSKSELLKELLNRAKSKKIEYTCTGCGFDTKSLYWYCPNCGEWESFR